MSALWDKIYHLILCVQVGSFLKQSALGRLGRLWRSIGTI
jgi:hypothetical protein